MSQSATITVKMKRGGTMELEAEGSVYNDSDGAGDRWTAIDDFEVYWPGKKGNKKRYPVDPKNFDVGAAEEAFIEAVESSRDNF